MAHLLVWVLGLALMASALAQSDTFARIAFVTLDGRLATIRPDGSDLMLLSKDEAEFFQFPAWSPDGRSLAAIRSRRDGGAVVVYRFTGDGAEESVLYSSAFEPPFYLYWSPDSRVVSFLANDSERVLALHLASPDDGSERVLTGGSPFYWQWTADSRRLLLHIGFAGVGARLGFSEVVTDTLLESLDTPGFFQTPGISPSGRFIAYGRYGPLGSRRVVLKGVDIDESIEWELPHRGLVALGWSPAEDLLAVMSPRRDVATFAGAIDLLEAESGLLKPLIDGPAIAFFWSPDGHHLAYFTRVAVGGGRVASADGGQRPLLGAGEQRVQQRLTLLELHVANIATGDTWLLTTFQPTASFVTQFLPFFGQYALSHQLWAPDSSALTLPLVDKEGVPQVAVVTLDGAVTTIAPGDSPFWNQR